jgi:hypothetical protein
MFFADGKGQGYPRYYPNYLIQILNSGPFKAILDYLAMFTARFWRITVTLICPG